ncbi:MAG: TetR family transcriptional regulator [Chloroflexia bacterium]
MVREQSRSRDRRQRVLDAALDIFTRDGYSDTLVDEIARRSDTSKGGVYFASRASRPSSSPPARQSGRLLTHRIERAIAAETDPLARGMAALRAVLHTFGSHRALARLLLVEALGAGHQFNLKMARNCTTSSRPSSLNR